MDEYIGREFDADDFALEEEPLGIFLRRHHKKVKDLKENFLVSCPFVDDIAHGGSDDKPSMTIFNDGYHNGSCHTCNNKIHNIYEYHGYIDYGGSLKGKVIHPPLVLPTDLVEDTSYMLKRGVSEEALYGELIFTSKELDGKGVKRCYIAYYRDEKLTWVEGRRIKASKEAKYVSMAGSSKFIYPATPIVDNGLLYIVEGYLDMLMFRTYGHYNTCCSGGVNIRAEDILKIPNITDVILVMDGDKAGIKANLRLEKALRKELHVSVITLPEGKDPASLTKEEFDKCV